MLTVILTRHGHTDRSEPEQYLGQRVRAELSERGRGDAQRLAERLSAVRLERVISSPLARAADTAAILARDVAVETDSRLAELDYGAWEGLTVEEIERRYPQEYELYETDPATHNIGGGESGEDVAHRLSEFISELVEWSAGQADEPTCLLVGHSSVNRVLLALLMDVPLRDYRRRFRSDWASLTVLRWPDRQAGPMLLLANDVAHVQGVGGATWD